MEILRWLYRIVVLFWALGLIFRIGGIMINWLLVIAIIVFIVDLIFGRRERAV